MRVTLCPGDGLPELDLELAVGATLGSLRERLADESGCPTTRTATLAVGGVVLDDNHRTGTFPLVAGARLRVGRVVVSDDGDLEAVRTPWHLAVVAGPDAGLLWPVSGRFAVGRDQRHPAGGLRLTDPRVSHAHLEVRVSGRRLTGRHVQVRDVGSANGTRLTRAWARHRIGRGVPRWWARWRAGDRVMLGDTVLELRASPAAATGAARGAATAHRPWGRKVLLGVTALGPVLGSLALVAGTGNPALLAVGLAGPALASLLATRPTPAPSPELVGSSRDRQSRPTSSRDTYELSGRDRDGGSDGSGEGRGGGAAGDAWTGPVDACALTADVARAVLTGEPALPGRGLEALAPGGVLAVRGPGARAVAATLALAAQPRGVEVISPGGEHWAWSRWLEEPAGLAAEESGPRVVVVDGAEPRPDWGGPGRVVVLVDPERVPSWCTAQLDATTGTWDGPDGVRVLEVRAGAPAWAHAQARRLAAVRCVRSLGAGGLPDAVTLGGLGLGMDAPEIARAWAAADGKLRTLVGAGAEGRDAVVDLVREGPHALVAGTTGSGKSELLRAIVTSLALRYPPTALAFALVDFKGGAGFGALADLPHVVGTVTDLDAHEAARALGGLAAELRRRKTLLADAGVADLRDWPSDSALTHPGRLVVVIDEFRALADELPDLMGALERIATQGRSLGVHLVLATQRPSGVVSAELRANVALRFALRVTDAQDSSDVIEVPDAATIPPSLPGRGLLRRGPGPVEELQVAQVGLGTPPVRLADGGRSADTGVGAPGADGGTLRTGASGDSSGAAPSGSPGEDFDDRLVAAVRDAAERWHPGAARPSAPWLPALPDDVTLAELDALTSGPAAGSTSRDATSLLRPDLLPLGLADVPHLQSRGVAAWDSAAGHLLVVGGPASGRSTLLATLGSAALARGWAVHAVGLPGDVWPTVDPAPAGVGTVCGPDDPRRLARLITSLRGAPARTLLLVDDVAEAWRALELVARGSGADRFAELLRARTVAVAATASRVAGPWAGQMTERVVLPVGDSVAEEMAGVPRALCGARRGPGRAIWIPARDEPLVCQVALAGSEHDPPPDASATGTSAPSRPISGTTSRPELLGPDRPPPRLEPLRLEAIPLVVPRPERPRARRRGLTVGVGGDDALPVTVPVDGGVLVVGPPGSGRSTAVAHLVRAAGLAGDRVVTLARDAGVLESGRAVGAAAGFDREEVLALLDGVQAGPALVVVDDLEQLVRLVPEAGDALDELVDAGGRLVASTTLDGALGAYRGAVATLRARRTGIVLAAHTPGGSDVFGTPLDWDVDVAHPHHPGRGVLQHGARLTPVQVFAPG